jgi:hypothetical protein
MRLLPLVLLVACSGGPAAGLDSADTEFCSTLDDGGTYEVEEGVGGNATSGQVEVRLITDEADSVNDPLYVAFKDFSLQNMESGGVQTIGKTTGDGLVSELVGAGQWAFQASWARGSTLCMANLELPSQPNDTTHGCAVMSCPE